MTEETLNLGEIPDFSQIVDDTRPDYTPFENGWYAGTIVEKREFTDKQGNDRIFESNDEVSRSGDSRNIRLQVEVQRQADKRTLNTSVMLNYQPEALTAETVQQVSAHMAKVKEGEEWGSLFRPFMTLTRLGKLQRIAGVRQLQRNGNGGLDIHPLFGKRAYFRLGPDERNPDYKAILDYSEKAPRKVL